MVETPPPPIDYASRGAPRPPNYFWRGLFLGIGYSAIIWLGYFGLQSPYDQLFPLFVILIGVKVIVGTSCLFVRPYRQLGIGILTSSLIAFMIFFSICLAALRGI